MTLKISRQIVPAAAERVRVLSRQGSVSVSQSVGCQGASVDATSAALQPLLSRSASGCFPPDGIARFYLGCQLFVGHGRNEEFFHANDGMAMPFVRAEEDRGG